MKENLTKRKQQAMETKRKIYITSIELIKQSGYEQVTVDGICDACQITKGAFYHHFKSKDDIVIGICMDMDRSLEAFIEEASSVKAPLERLEGILNYYIKFTAEIGLDATRQIYKLMVDGKHDYLVSAQRYPSVVLYQTVQDGQEAGIFRRDLSSERIVKHLNNFIFGLSLNWCIAGGSYDIEKEGRNSISELMIYIRNGA